MFVEHLLSCDHGLVKSHICVKCCFFDIWIQLNRAVKVTHVRGGPAHCALGSTPHPTIPPFGRLPQHTPLSLSPHPESLSSPAVMPHSRRRKTSLRPGHRLQSVHSFLSIAFHSASFRSIHTFPFNSRDLWILIFYRVWQFLCRILYILFPWITPPDILFGQKLKWFHQMGILHTFVCWFFLLKKG